MTLNIKRTTEVREVGGLELRTWKGTNDKGEKVQVFIPDWIDGEFVFRRKAPQYKKGKTVRWNPRRNAEPALKPKITKSKRKAKTK